MKIDDHLHRMDARGPAGCGVAHDRHARLGFSLVAPGSRSSVASDHASSGVGAVPVSISSVTCSVGAAAVPSLPDAAAVSGSASVSSWFNAPNLLAGWRNTTSFPW